MADKLTEEEVDTLLGDSDSDQEGAAPPDLDLLLQLSDWKVRGLACQLDHEELLQVLLSAGEPVREKILRNVSERRRAPLLKEIEQEWRLKAEKARELGNRVAQMAGEWIEEGEATADAPEEELAPLREKLGQLDRRADRWRSDLSAATGALLTLLLISGGQFLGERIFTPVLSLVFVLLGALATLWILAGWKSPWNLVRVAAAAFTCKLHPAEVWIAYLAYCNQAARTYGILILETEEVGFDRLIDPRLKEWLRLATAGTEPVMIAQLALTNISAMEQRHLAGSNLLRMAGFGSLLFGALGLGLGAMQLPAGHWREAMLFPIWGLLASGTLLALRHKLRQRSEVEVGQYRLILEGVRGIQYGETPARVCQRLAALAAVSPSAVEEAAQKGFAEIMFDQPEKPEANRAEGAEREQGEGSAEEEMPRAEAEEQVAGEETGTGEEENPWLATGEEAAAEDRDMEQEMLAAMMEDDENSSGQEGDNSGGTQEQEGLAEVQEEWVEAATEGGPEVERVAALLVAGEGAVYAGVTSGLYHSPDEGVTWEKTGLMDKEVSALAELAGALFAGTIEEGALLPAGEAFRSPDRGRTWAAVFSGFAADTFTGCGTVLYAGAGGLQRSLDGGRTWSQLPSSMTLPGMVHAPLVHEWRLYAGTSGGVYCSEDGGESWKLAGLAHSEVWVLAVLEGILLAGTGNGLFLSRDQGETWTDMGLAEKSVRALLCAGDALYAGTDAGVFQSRDQGSNWTPLDLAGSPANAIAFSGSRLLVGTNSGVLSIPV